MISGIRYKSWHQPLAIPYSGIFVANDSLILHNAANKHSKALLSQSADTPALAVQKWSWANAKSFWKSYCDCASFTRQHLHLTLNWVKLVLVELFEIILPLHLSSFKASAGDLWPFWVLYAKTVRKQLRKIQTKLGNLRYGKEWKNWVCLSGKWDWGVQHQYLNTQKVSRKGKK